jgi:hypothetical protein
MGFHLKIINIPLHRVTFSTWVDFYFYQEIKPFIENVDFPENGFARTGENWKS